MVDGLHKFDIWETLPITFNSFEDSASLMWNTESASPLPAGILSAQTQPIECNNLIQDVVEETSLSKVVDTTASDFYSASQ